jgi:hypothetical protein
MFRKLTQKAAALLAATVFCLGGPPLSCASSGPTDDASTAALESADVVGCGGTTLEV